MTDTRPYSLPENHNRENTHMRPITEVDPVPTTRDAILSHGMNSLAMLAPGSHQDLTGRYAALREVKAYAQSILDAADAADE